jgi:hypothetical protein
LANASPILDKVGMVLFAAIDAWVAVRAFGLVGVEASFAGCFPCPFCCCCPCCTCFCLLLELSEKLLSNVKSNNAARCEDVEEEEDDSDVRAVTKEEFMSSDAATAAAADFATPVALFGVVLPISIFLAEAAFFIDAVVMEVPVVEVVATPFSFPAPRRDEVVGEGSLLNNRDRL